MEALRKSLAFPYLDRMRTIKRTGMGILILSLFLSACTEDEGRISNDDIRGAESLFGLEFEKWELDTMRRYLERNLEGYDSMRYFPLDMNIAPAMAFDPRPIGFEVNLEEDGIADVSPESTTLPDDPAEIAFMSVAELSTLIRTQQISSVDLTKLYLDRLKRYDTLQAVVSLTEELAMEQARRADDEIQAGQYKGVLHGLPYGMKDLAAVPGFPTTWGAESYKDQYLETTATVARLLEEAGAVLVAKLVSGTLARGDVWFGGQTKNPWDLEQGASGSSAGSGSAVSAGLVAFAIGTETLGSILSPSTRCGITGLRPTYGRVSRYGFMSLSWSMDKVGPMCRTAYDCALVMDAIRGIDPRDPSTVEAGFGFQPAGSLEGYRIAYLAGSFENDSSETGFNNDRSLEELRGMGADLEAIELPEGIPYNAFDIILRAEAGAFFEALVREHGDRDLVEQHYGSRANSLRQSRFIPAVEYLQANRHRAVLIEKFNALLKDYDVVISPSRDYRQSTITNLTGHPAIAVPNGFDEEGHPTSFTILGNLYDEKSVLEVAHIYQSRTGYHLEHPEMFR